MPVERRLNDRQFSLLKRIAEGDDLSAGENPRDKMSAYALSNRGLIKITKHGGVFRAALAGAGRARVASGQTTTAPGRPESRNTSSSRRKAPDTTVEIANARKVQAKELMAELSVESTFTVVRPTEEELALWRKIVDFAKRHDLVPEGKRLEKSITRDKDLKIMLIDGTHLNTKPAASSDAAPSIRVPETLRGCHPVIAKLRDDEHCLMMPKQQRHRCLLILQAIAVEARQRGYLVKDASVDMKRYGYYAGGSRARDGAIAVKIDEFDLAVTIGQVSPNSSKPERLEELVLALPWRGVRDRQTRWADGKRRKAEDVLGLVLPELETQAEEAKQRKIDEERAEAERRVQWELAMKRAGAAAVTAFKVKILDQQVADWRRAAMLREYCAALAERLARAERSGEAVDQGMHDWAEWAVQYAAVVDPLTLISSMPDDPELSPSDLAPFLGKWSPYGPESGHGRGWRS